MNGLPEADRTAETGVSGRQEPRPEGEPTASPCRRADMAQSRGFNWRQRERLDALSRLESLILRETKPDAWNAGILATALDLAKRFGDLEDSDDSDRIAVLVNIYRLSYRARIYRAPREWFFWLLNARLHCEAHFGPEALVRQKEYLGPLWERLDAIHKKHGWPKHDENGDLWNPEDHLEQVPEDYAAWAAEFERVADEMEKAAFRATCEHHGVPEIADMKENAPEEYERRCRIGHAYGERMRAEDEGKAAG